jgi:hypothetical protein
MTSGEPAAKSVVFAAPSFGWRGSQGMTSTSSQQKAWFLLLVGKFREVTYSVGQSGGGKSSSCA